ncbi:class F sortase [Streptomyces sp. NPDC087226]|uniref:class F sortase n=1 Tax=Streptomyces sp. NPDC087226 TaxID=3365771 RepID=UPI0038248ABC
MPASPSSPLETEQPPPARRRLRAIMTAVFWSGAGVLLAVTLMGGGETPPDDAHGPRAASAASAAPSPAASAPAAGEPAGPRLARSEPTRLLIPAIGVDAPFTDLAIDAKGRLEPPPAHDTNLVGWYAKGVSPGERGTAIIAGHVDTATSAAVFVRLGELEKGDRFRVLRADGSKATFVVDETESFAKDDFPNERVYADTPDAQVRLITCSGSYDHAVRDYTENLVVFAHLV